jgi:hypothetical protein
VGEKRIGIVKIGTIPQVVNVVIDRIVYLLQKKKMVNIMGIQTNILNEDRLEYISFREEVEGTRLCSLSYNSWISQHSNILNSLDILFVFYNEEDLVNYDNIQQNTTCRILLVPINLFNEQNPTVNHLGFDSALNEVLNNIHKVKDTASSLLFSNKRLFLIKIPGKKTGVFIKEAAIALQCELLEEESSSEFQRLIKNLEEKYLEGHNHAFLLFNETVNEEEIKKGISATLNLDFRSVMIEEAQCIGGNSTASDRLQAMTLVEKMVDWTLLDHHFDMVRLVKNSQIKIEALNKTKSV